MARVYGGEPLVLERMLGPTASPCTWTSTDFHLLLTLMRNPDGW
jgi:hypothetical protein